MSNPKSVDLQGLRTYPQLDQIAFQHPADREATNGLKSIFGLPFLINQISGSILETATRLQHLSHCIRVGPNQAREVYRQCVRAYQILWLPEMPEVYISPENIVNAYAIGMRQPVITLTRGLIESMTPDERLCVIAHEMAHIKCEHMVHKTVANLIAILGVVGIARLLPLVGEAVMMSVATPLYAWSRKAELSCDRAALLVVQDPEIVASTLAKLAGWPSNLGTINYDVLREQAALYDQLDDDTVAAVFKIVNALNSEVFLTHPMPVQRLRSILLWGQSDEYNQILEGKYPRRIQNPPKRCCIECGTEMRDEQLICPNCRKENPPAEALDRWLTCPQCGRKMNPGDRYCGNCTFAVSQFGEAGSLRA